MSNPAHYPAQVFWSEEDEGYIAFAPDLPGCSAWGETRETAAAELQDAIAAWIEAHQAAGNPIPSPSKPTAATQQSGRVLLRLPKSLHAKLARDAEADGVSLNTHLVSLLSGSSSSDRGQGMPVEIDRTRRWATR